MAYTWILRSTSEHNSLGLNDDLVRLMSEIGATNNISSPTFSSGRITQHDPRTGETSRFPYLSGSHVEIYEIPGEGAIIYDLSINGNVIETTTNRENLRFDKSTGFLCLSGFDEDSELFKETQRKVVVGLKRYILKPKLKLTEEKE